MSLFRMMRASVRAASSLAMPRVGVPAISGVAAFSDHSSSASWIAALSGGAAAFVATLFVEARREPAGCMSPEEAAKVINSAFTHKRHWDESFRHADEPAAEVNAWAAWCAAFDVDGDGDVGHAEFKQYFKRKGASRRLRRKGLSEQKAEAVAAVLMQRDTNGDGRVDFAEWCTVWERDLPHGILGSGIRESLPYLRSTFKKIDTNNDNAIPKETLEVFLEALYPMIADSIFAFPHPKHTEAIRQVAMPADLYEAPAFKKYANGDFGDLHHPGDEITRVSFAEFVIVWFYVVEWTITSVYGSNWRASHPHLLRELAGKTATLAAVADD